MIRILQGTDINNAMLALNYYISTGDHVGEGVALEDVNTPGGDAVILQIVYRPREWEDKDNWERLKARLDELITEGFPLGLLDYGHSGEFHHWGIRMKRASVESFAAKIKENPGPRGWGSMYTFLERHGFIEKNNG